MKLIMLMSIYVLKFQMIYTVCVGQSKNTRETISRSQRTTMSTEWPCKAVSH